jgi:hypothetical protein
MTFCQSKGGIPYFETSAKEAINVEQAFEGKHPYKHNRVLFPGANIRSHRTTSPSTRRRRGLQQRLPRDHPDRSQGQ